MAEWKTYKGEGPWAFVKGPNKYTYNEGSSISVNSNPVWPVPDGSIGAPITATHKPCGYWYNQPAPLVTRSESYYPTVGLHTGWWRDDGVVGDYNFPIIGSYSGDSYNAWTTFPLVDIPQGATIISATVTIYAMGIEIGTPCNFHLRFLAADTATFCADPSYPIYYATLTGMSLTSAVGWPFASIPAGFGSATTTPSLVTPLQEVISRPGWATGHALLFLFYANASLSCRTACNYNAAPFDIYNSRLDVTFSY